MRLFPPIASPSEKNGNRREPRTTNELAEGVAEILKERVHLGPLL